MIKYSISFVLHIMYLQYYPYAVDVVPSGGEYCSHWTQLLWWNQRAHVPS